MKEIDRPILDLLELCLCLSIRQKRAANTFAPLGGLETDDDGGDGDSEVEEDASVEDDGNDRFLSFNLQVPWLISKTPAMAAVHFMADTREQKDIRDPRNTTLDHELLRT